MGVIRADRDAANRRMRRYVFSFADTRSIFSNLVAGGADPLDFSPPIISALELVAKQAVLLKERRLRVRPIEGFPGPFLGDSVRNTDLLRMEYLGFDDRIGRYCFVASHPKWPEIPFTDELPVFDLEYVDKYEVAARSAATLRKKRAESH